MSVVALRGYMSTSQSPPILRCHRCLELLGIWDKRYKILRHVPFTELELRQSWGGAVLHVSGNSLEDPLSFVTKGLSMPRRYRCNCCLGVVDPASGIHARDLVARRPEGAFCDTMSALVSLAPDRYEGCAHFVLFRLRAQFPGTADAAQDYYTYNTPSIFKGEYEAESYDSYEDTE